MKNLFIFSILIVFSSLSYGMEQIPVVAYKAIIPAEFTNTDGKSMMLIDFLKKDMNSPIFKQTMHHIERFKDNVEYKEYNARWYSDLSTRMTIAGSVGIVMGSALFIHIPVLIGSVGLLGYQGYSWYQHKTNLNNWNALYNYLCDKSNEQVRTPQEILALNTFLISRIQNFSLSFDKSCIVQLDLHE